MEALTILWSLESFPTFPPHRRREAEFPFELHRCQFQPLTHLYGLMDLLCGVKVWQEAHKEGLNCWRSCTKHGRTDNVLLTSHVLPSSNFYPLFVRSVILIGNDSLYSTVSIVNYCCYLIMTAFNSNQYTFMRHFSSLVSM